MKMDNQTYDEMRKKASPPSPVVRDCLWAFFVGGAICCAGEGLGTLYRALGFTLTDAGTLTSATLVALSGLFTALGWYQKLAAKAGAGTLVPITGFANAVVSPAIETSRGLPTPWCRRPSSSAARDWCPAWGRKCSSLRGR